MVCVYSYIYFFELFFRILLTVYSECLSIHQMIDKQHSYCAKKISVRSLPPIAEEIKLILEIHNQERTDVNAKYMQKMGHVK